MKKRWPASTALLYLVVGTLSSFLIIDMFVFWKHSKTVRETIISSNIQILETTKQLQSITINDVRFFLQTLAKSPTILEGNPAKIQALFKNIEKNQPNYNGFNIFTPDGKTLISIQKNKNAGSPPPNVIREKRYFKDAIATKSFTVGEYFTSSGLAHIDSLPASLPIYDTNGKLKYVIMVTINIQKVSYYYLQLAALNSKTIQMYDSNKTLIFTSNEKNSHLVGTKAKLEYIADIINSNNTSPWQEIKDLDENNMIISLSTLTLKNAKNPYMYFLVSSSSPSTFTLIKDNYLLEISGVFFSLAISMLLVYWTVHYYFSQGLEQLTNVATAAQNGNISIRNGHIAGCRELQILGKAFDSMLANLETSTTRLHEQKARLDFALNGAQVATWEWDTLSKKYILDRRGISLLGYCNSPNNFIDLGALMQKYDLQQAQITMEQHVEDKIPSFEYEVKLVHQDGSQIWFILQGRKEITTLTHNVQRIFGICIDITQRKKLERFEIERAEYFKRLSHKDALTGLSNRRHFIEQAQIMVQHSLRHGHSFSLGMLDLDFFKNINDTHGHIVGDEVLRNLAELLTDTVRKTDIVGRYGGEEFIFLLPETDQDKAVSASEKIRKSIMDLVIFANSQEITFTASIGICTYTPKISGFNTNEQISSIIVDLTSCADDNLYQAKNSGRNRVVSSSYTYSEQKK